MPALGTLYIVSAPSGAGKSSLISALIEKNTNNDLQVSVSHTTRQPRPGEVNGQHYHFVDVDGFKSLINDGVFFEWAEVFGNYYGTSRTVIEQQLANGIDVFLDIDWQGARQVKELMPQAKGIFILPPSRTELERRLVGRGTDSDEVIASRMQKAISEMSHYNEYDYLLINDSFEQALQDFDAIIKGNRLIQQQQAIKHCDMLKDLLAE
ncbi:guanylate kinase [Psychrobium sp. 1_MG-2023]|uniref:guanylate kinase n=1 Tax=Psychrobium sp. 1_MG-2023 TaxID=3062624 RepID=UPI000C33BAFE|nr:guanylate kinase [Psychrobium sp. 1_MG-2023]MDP2562829.1 guanylate kinase [Psychrobium sp. 1_MG-2023]PKF57952.1 guanylate kinase [Alteromonadales bacterium alter-6D02]